MLEAGLVCIRAYSGNIFIQPRHKVAELHYVVGAVHLRVGGVAVPEFPDGRCPVLGHVAPARVFLVCCQQPCHVGAAHVRKSVHQPLCADNAAGHQSLACRYDVVNNVFLDFSTYVVVVNHAERKRKDIRRSGVVAVERAIRIEYVSRNEARAAVYAKELLVEGILYVCCLGCILGCFGVL